MRSLKARSTGITLALTIALAVGLSIAPVPEALKPFPSLVRAPLGDALASLLLPERSGSRSQEVMTGAPVAGEPDSDVSAGVAPVELEEEIRAAREAAGESAGTEPPPSPAATLGASRFGSVRHLEREAKKVGATHVDIESPASLERFFSKLEALQQSERHAPVRVVHLGDSQIASDYITDFIRDRLQLRYGSGGRGFLFVDRPTKLAGRDVRTGKASPEWAVSLLTDKAPRGVFGFTGARFVASKTRETTEFELGDARSAELFFATGPEGGLLEVLADGKPISSVFTRLADQNMAFTRVQIPWGAKKLQLASAEGEVSLFGVSLENDAPGVVYDSVGLPGAQFEVYLRAPEDAFSAQLAKRDPSLVVLMLGGNESYALGRGRITLDDVRTNASKLIDRIRKAVPEADCLLFSPLDAGIRTIGGTIEPRPHTEDVRKVTREVALAKGCAYWDLLTAMGGSGSVPKWIDAKLFNSDLVHPRQGGADLMGHLFDFALERARSNRPSARNPASGDPLGLQTPKGKPLAKTFEKLAALKKNPKNAEAVRIVQLGASHTASHMFTDVVREQLARSFGATSGRGFVAAGRASSRLTPGGVSRSLDGDWKIPDAREGEPGEPWGLTGIRAEGEPGAKLTITFGVGRQPGTEPARMSLYYLEAPGMGRMEVRIDGELQEILPSADERSGGARVRSFPVKGLSHSIEVINAGDGPIAVFGAALDVERGGIVYDALGLPGSTAGLTDDYDKTVFGDQLRERRPDLYVLFYGTNESAFPDLDAEEYARRYTSLLRTLREASPSAECLLIGPTDRIADNDDGRLLPAESIDLVLRTVREVAAREGCAFWSSRAAMGGPFAMRRWQSTTPPLGHPDGVHLTREGYAALARAFVDDLLAAYRSR